MRLSVARVEAITWILIYGGLLGASLGFALGRNGARFGWALVVVGVAAVVVGAILVWVRSRMNASAER